MKIRSAELAIVLQTDPNYLILGNVENEVDDSFINEASALLEKITDPLIQEMLLKQIRALM